MLYCQLYSKSIQLNIHQSDAFKRNMTNWEDLKWRQAKDGHIFLV